MTIISAFILIFFISFWYHKYINKRDIPNDDDDNNIQQQQQQQQQPKSISNVDEIDCSKQYIYGNAILNDIITDGRKTDTNHNIVIG